MKKNMLFVVAFACMQFCLGNGVLIKNQETGEYATMTESVVFADVQNQVATIISSQTFVNQYATAFDGKYGFPMPSEASVTQLRWRINGGDWNYAQFTPGGGGNTGSGGAVNPTLEDYMGETPLYFSFNNPIEPEDVVEVELTYVELLPYSFNEVTFEFPSDYSLIQPSISGTQSFLFEMYSERTIMDVQLLTNSGTITNDGNNATVSIEVTNGASLEDVLIVYELSSEELGVIAFSTLLPEGTVECDDFGDGFFGLVIEPESNANTEVIDKNFILIMDRSGSMSGNKIAQAKDAASFIVNNLNANDKFNIVSFSSDVNSVTPELAPYNVTTQNDALQYIDDMVATGSTNISGALVYSIEQFEAFNPEEVNIVVFFTDGAATSGQTNTQTILEMVQDAVLANETQIFMYTFGIGESVTTDLLTNLAIQNNGFPTFLGNNEIEDVISNFYLTIKNPVLLNPELTIDPPNAIDQLFPTPLPNLYKGQQLIMAGRYTQDQAIDFTLTGYAFNEQVEYSYNIELSDFNDPNYAFLPKLWAKKKLESLLLLYYSYPPGSPEAEEILDEIEETSICYEVLSPFTGLSDGSPLSIEEFLAELEETNLPFTPNPFTQQTVAYVNLHAGDRVRMEIYGIDGKLIDTDEFLATEGANEIRWDGTDRSSVEVEPGLFIYRIYVNGKLQFYGKLIKK